MPDTSACRSRKFVYTVVIDPGTRRILLVQSGAAADARWTAPKAIMRSGATYRYAAVRFLRRRRRLQPVRLASVVGRLFAIDDTEKPGYVVLVLPESGRWTDKPGSMFGPAARWWTLDALRADHVFVEPPQLLDLVDGYWDGWLPDGEVSLV